MRWGEKLDEPVRMPSHVETEERQHHHDDPEENSPIVAGLGLGLRLRSLNYPEQVVWLQHRYLLFMHVVVMISTMPSSLMTAEETAILHPEM